MASASTQAPTKASNKVRLGNNSAHSFGNRFSALRLSRQFADFLVTCSKSSANDGEPKNTHRFVLAANSPVFAKMLGNDQCEETKKGRVVIDDYNADVVAAMLDYMYSSSCEIEPKSLFQLLSISEKYQLADLKRLCDEQLGNQVDLASAIDIVLFSDLHSAPISRRAGFEFLAEHHDSITASVIESFHGHDPLIKEFKEAIVRYERRMADKRAEKMLSTQREADYASYQNEMRALQERLDSYEQESFDDDGRW